jgi:hypothetical protein
MHLRGRLPRHEIDRNKSVMCRIRYGTDDRHDGTSLRIAVTRTCYLRSLRRTPLHTCMHAASHAASGGQVAARRRWGSYFTRAQACRGTLGEAGGHRGRQWGDRNIRAQVPYPAITLPCAASSSTRRKISNNYRGGRPAGDPSHASCMQSSTHAC